MNICYDALEGMIKMIDFGTRLSILRNERGLSQEEFGGKIGLSRNSIYNYETGKRTPSIEDLVKIADFFNVSYDFLLCKSENKNRDNIDIGEKLGLEDESISALQKIKNEYFSKALINELLQSKLFLKLLRDYIYLNFVSIEITKTKYNILTNKRGSYLYNGYYFARIIEELPKMKETINNKLKSDPSLLRVMYFEFAKMYTSSIVEDDHSDYEGIVEDFNDFNDIDLSEDVISEDEIKHHEQEQREFQEAIDEFDDYLNEN